jgi:hypothetical protein
MPWTNPGTAVAGDVLTAAFWNEQVRDNLTELNTPSHIVAAGTTAATGVISTDLTYDAASITLTAGKWLVRACVGAKNTGSVDSQTVGIWNNTAAAIVADSTGIQSVPGTSFVLPQFSRTVLITVTTSTVFRPRVRRNGGSIIQIDAAAAGGVSGFIEAIRVGLS